MSEATAMTDRIHPLAGALASFVRLLTGVHARWVECLPDPRQRVYFANHTSHLDFVVLWSALPANIRALTRPVAARDYWQSGFRAYLALNVFHAVLIDRKPDPANPRNFNPIDLMLDAIGDSGSLILFPEGTRGDGLAVAPFRSGLYYLAAARPELELVPVYLENLSRILPRGEIFPAPLIGRLTFGPPLHLEPGEAKQAFLDRAHAAVTALGVRGQA